MTRADARRLKLTRSLEEAHALADAVLSRARAHSRRTAPKRAERVKAEEGKRATKAAQWRAIKESVRGRAGGQCEAWRMDSDGCWEPCGGPAVTVDHWLGGSGRRLAEQSVETCWALCARCDRDRTNSMPSAAYWNASNKHHCFMYRLPHTPHVTNEPEAHRVR